MPKLGEFTDEQRAQMVAIANAALADCRLAPGLTTTRNSILPNVMNYKAGVLGIIGVFGDKVGVVCYRCWLKPGKPPACTPAIDALRLITCEQEPT